MTNAKQCDFCDRQVVWLVMAYGGKMELFDAANFRFDELPGGNRWAFSRNRGGVVDADSVKHPPIMCLRKHYCKGSYENRRYRLWTVTGPSSKKAL